MTKSENKIIAHFLEMCSDTAGNAGCNDLPSGFFDHMPDDEREQFRLDFIEWVGDPDYEIDDVQYAQDWMIMGFLKDRLINETR